MKLKKLFFITFSLSLNLAAISCSTNTNTAFAGKIIQAQLRSTTLSPSDSQTLKAKADSIFQPEIDSGNSIGLIVGIIQGKNKSFFGYGTTNKNKKIVPDERTMFHIASISKVFTSTLLADMVINNSVKLSDTIEKFLPDSVNPPKFEQYGIPLVMLATHTSGLPNSPGDLDKINYNPYVPYANYKVPDLYNYLSGFKLTQDSNQKTGFGYYLYSNLGYGLLGHILSHKLGMTYENAIKTKICEPLNLKDTVITLSADQKNRFAKGYLKKDNQDLEMSLTGAGTTDALAGSFALKSDAHDLLNFVGANLGQTNSKLNPAFNLAHKEIFPEINMALGWHTFQTTSGKKAIWHNGAWTASGFTGFIGFIKETNTGVVILSNTISFTEPGQNTTNAGFKLLNSL